MSLALYLVTNAMCRRSIRRFKLYYMTANDWLGEEGVHMLLVSGLLYVERHGTMDLGMIMNF